jgi:hypothetical protein
MGATAYGHRCIWVPLPKLIVRVRGSGFPYIRFCKIFTGYVFGSFKRLFFCHLTQNPTELGQTSSKPCFGNAVFSLRIVVIVLFCETRDISGELHQHNHDAMRMCLLMPFPEWSGLDLSKNLIIFSRKFSSTLGLARNASCLLLYVWRYRGRVPPPHSDPA